MPAFGPSAIWSVGAGAVLPVVALSARGLGASVGLAALFVGITTLSEFAAAVPGRRARRADRRAPRARGRRCAGCRRVRARARRPLAVGAGRRRAASWGRPAPCSSWPGRATSPPPPRCALRARAMSTLGGVTRIGLFVGPLIGAPVVARWGPQAAFAVAVVAGLLAARRWRWRTPDLGAHHERLSAERERVPVAPGRARRTAGCCSPWGWGCSPSGWPGPRGWSSCRCGPSTSGSTAAQTSLVFAAAALVEVVLFYPAGTVMDRHGRVWVAVPVTAAARPGAGRPAAHHHARRRRRRSRCSWGSATASARASS